MDKTIKDRIWASAQTCALYCFPELSCETEHVASQKLSGSHFVGETNGGSDDFSIPEDDSKEKGSNDEQIQAAYNKGLKKGRNEMMAAYQASIDKAARALQSAVAELVQLRQGDIEKMEAETVRLALAIARKIVGIEAERGTAIRHVVKAALEKVGDPRHLTLRLNPNDIAMVEKFKQELLLGDDPDTICRIEPDETIDRGGCMVETQLGDVDARIDQQIQIIADLLNDQRTGLWDAG